MVCSRLNKQTAGQREHWDKPETDVSKPARARDYRAHLRGARSRGVIDGHPLLCNIAVRAQRLRLYPDTEGKSDG